MNAATKTLPAEWYTNQDIYQRERRKIFARQWIYVAHVSEIRNAGDYLTTHIAGYSIGLLRQPDGVITAFHNVCRHRAAPLLTSPRGCLAAKTITCPYHGWSYNLKGQLVAAPHFDCWNECDRAELSLYPIQVAIYRGLVFVNLSADAPAFDAGFGELLQTIDLSEFDLESYEPHSQVTREGNFNWKVWVDGYQECYHCMTIHPIFTRDFALQKYQVQNRHHFSIHSCDRKKDSQSGTSNGLWLWVYPNLGLPIYEPCFYTLQVNPLGVGRTRLTYTFHFRRGASESLVQEFRNFVDQITDEDIRICESVQVNLEAGVYDTGFLHASRENGVAYFQSLVRDAVLAEDDHAQPTALREACPV